MNEIIEWLRSPEGEEWALDNAVNGGRASRHEFGIFGSIKPDIESRTGWAEHDTAFEMKFGEK